MKEDAWITKRLVDGFEGGDLFGYGYCTRCNEAQRYGTRGDEK